MAEPCLVGGSNFHSCRRGGPRRRTMALVGSQSPSWSTSVTFAASHSLSHFQLAIFFFILRYLPLVAPIAYSRWSFSTSFSSR